LKKDLESKHRLDSHIIEINLDFLKLERIDYKNQHINEIDSFAFKDLKNLYSVDLSGNEINYIDPHLFNGLFNLSIIKVYEFIIPSIFCTNLQYNYPWFG
jgi:Leucine-rich repeat (LRR) protein